MSLQGSLKCSGWLNISNFMRQRIPDRRSCVGKWTMSKCFGLYVRNAQSSWVRWGAELPWWRVDTEKVRQMNKGCIREKGVTKSVTDENNMAMLLSSVEFFFFFSSAAFSPSSSLFPLTPAWPGQRINRSLPTSMSNIVTHAYSHYSWSMTLNKQLPWAMVWASLSVQLSNVHFRSTGLARKRETTQYNIAELIQARQIMAAPMYRDTAPEHVVNLGYPFTFHFL